MFSGLNSGIRVTSLIRPYTTSAGAAIAADTVTLSGDLDELFGFELLLIWLSVCSCSDALCVAGTWMTQHPGRIDSPVEEISRNLFPP